MSSQPTNAARDRVQVDNRLDVIVLSVHAAGDDATTTLTPAEARAVARALGAAADSAEITPR